MSYDRVTPFSSMDNLISEIVPNNFWSAAYLTLVLFCFSLANTYNAFSQ